MPAKRGVELKALDDSGHGLARIATLSAVDSDGDTYAPGAFGRQWAAIQPAHDGQSVPLGKARVFEAGGEALAELHFNLGTAAGREWHAALKFDLDGCWEGAPPIQQWSYGFSVRASSRDVREGQRVRVLERLDVHEVSPVLRGAGVATATLALKRDEIAGEHDAETLFAPFEATQSRIDALLRRSGSSGCGEAERLLAAFTARR